MSEEAALSGFTRFEFTDPKGRWTRPVYRAGSGPAVIVIHEMPGLHPLVVRFADRVAAAGMTVFCPACSASRAGRSAAAMRWRTMLQRHLHPPRVRRLGDRTAPARSSIGCARWPRKAHAECGGKGVGAVGMCFTGNFALAMMTEPAVVAPVLSQPSMPLPLAPGASAPPASASRRPRSPAPSAGSRTRTCR